MTAVHITIYPRFLRNRLINLPTLVAHRLMQKAQYRLKIPNNQLVERICLNRYKNDITINMYPHSKHISDCLKYLAQKLLRTRQTANKITVCVPTTLSPTIVMIELPYEPEDHAGNRICLVNSTQLKMIIKPLYI